MALTELDFGKKRIRNFGDFKIDTFITKRNEVKFNLYEYCMTDNSVYSVADIDSTGNLT